MLLQLFQNACLQRKPLAQMYCKVPGGGSFSADVRIRSMLYRMASLGVDFLPGRDQDGEKLRV